MQIEPTKRVPVETVRPGQHLGPLVVDEVSIRTDGVYVYGYPPHRTEGRRQVSEFKHGETVLVIANREERHGVLRALHRILIGDEASPELTVDGPQWAARMDSDGLNLVIDGWELDLTSTADGDGG